MKRVTKYDIGKILLLALKIGVGGSLAYYIAELLGDVQVIPSQSSHILFDICHVLCFVSCSAHTMVGLRNLSDCFSDYM